MPFVHTNVCKSYLLTTPNGRPLIRLRPGPLPQRLLWAISIVLGVEILRTAWRALRSHADRTLDIVQAIVRMSLIAVVSLMFVAPRAAAWMTSRDLAATLNTAGTLPPRVRVLDERIGSLIFYLDPRLRAQATVERVDAASFPEGRCAATRPTRSSRSGTTSCRASTGCSRRRPRPTRSRGRSRCSASIRCAPRRPDKKKQERQEITKRYRVPLEEQQATEEPQPVVALPRPRRRRRASGPGSGPRPVLLTQS